MKFVEAREEIQNLFEERYPIKFGLRSRGIIGSILWNVAENDSPESANALIRIFHLYMFEYGSFQWFNDKFNSGEYRPIVGHPDEISLMEHYYKPPNKRKKQ